MRVSHKLQALQTRGNAAGKFKTDHGIAPVFFGVTCVVNDYFQVWSDYLRYFDSSLFPISIT